ncbi:hypothetical protein OG488_00880 [Streptomyces sp. NBC_01460]|uniref:hypothetical protein n=1 Tax=Streptomyces sp. NBC_01460 TaxID=2903875 RepID=UPI002E34B4E4|nr:hypothetical protein [Streptomyces sp. NBC_01460]
MQQSRRDEARAADQKRAERERAAATAADEVRQAQACEDCGQQQAAGLCEACGYRRRTEALIAEAGMVAATWSADLTDQDAIATVTTDVRAALEHEVAAGHARYLNAMDQDAQNENPTGFAAALAYGALQTVEEALPEFRHSAPTGWAGPRKLTRKLGGHTELSTTAAGSSTTRTGRMPSPRRRRQPTPPGRALRSTRSRRGWSSCVSRLPPGPSSPRPHHGWTGFPSLLPGSWRATPAVIV